VREVFKARYVDQFARVAPQGQKRYGSTTCGDYHHHRRPDRGGVVCWSCCTDISAWSGWPPSSGTGVLVLRRDHQRRAISGTREEIQALPGCWWSSWARSRRVIAYIEDYASLGMSEQNYQWIRRPFHA